MWCLSLVGIWRQVFHSGMEEELISHDCHCRSRLVLPLPPSSSLAGCRLLDLHLILNQAMKH